MSAKHSFTTPTGNCWHCGLSIPTVGDPAWTEDCPARVAAQAVAVQNRPAPAGRHDWQWEPKATAQWPFGHYRCGNCLEEQEHNTYGPLWYGCPGNAKPARIGAADTSFEPWGINSVVRGDPAPTWRHGYWGHCKVELTPAMDGDNAKVCSGCTRKGNR